MDKKTVLLLLAFCSALTGCAGPSVRTAVSAPEVVHQREMYIPPMTESNRTCAPAADPSPIIQSWDALKAKMQGQLALMGLDLESEKARADCESKLKATWADLDAAMARVEAENAANAASALATISRLRATSR